MFIYVHVYISLEIDNQKRFDEMGKKRKIEYIFIQIHTYVYIIKKSINSLKHRAITKTIKWGRRSDNKGVKEIKEL